jgi:acyl carrier protein
MAIAFNIPLEAIGDHAKIGTLPEWDSIGHLRLVLELEQRLKRQLSADEIVGIASCADVEKLLASVAAE